MRVFVTLASLLVAVASARSFPDRINDGSIGTPHERSSRSGGNASHLHLMSMYGMNPALQEGWVNMNLEGSLSDKLAAFSEHGIPSFFGDVEGVFNRGKGLVSGWQTVLDEVVNSSILPNFGPGKALRGVFLGDEICCQNVSCWDTALAPVAARLRASLGPEAIIYTNECAVNLSSLGGVPADLDLISVDVYAGYLPGSNGTDEVAAARQMYETNVFPNLRPHQQVMLVPGIFACSNQSFYPLEQQSLQVVTKLDAFFEWVRWCMTQLLSAVLLIASMNEVSSH